MKRVEKELSANASRGGSALILAVVLTSLLAIVGVLFVMASSVDNLATSAVSETKELDFAVDTIVAEISRELVLDVPGVAGHEYYDYPDANDTWLAALEPYLLGADYYWRQTSNLYNSSFDPNVQAVPVPDYQDPAVIVEGAAADAAGDGVADSRWAIVPEISSTKGKPIFAAVRIVDHGAMLNANTAFKFYPGDPNATLLAFGGSGQLHINLLGVAGAPGQPPAAADETDLLYARANSGLGVDPFDLRKYEQNVIWRYDDPNGPYTPFDMSDELELRYRFLLNHSDIDTRLEQWGGHFRSNTLSTPVTSGGRALDAWFQRAGDSSGLDPNYAYRHVATTDNMDRIIHPAGETLNDGKMINVNTADENLLYEAIREGLGNIDPNVADVDRLAAQLAVNIVDLRDQDTDVTVMPMGAATYYGLEPQPFISEIGFLISETDADVSTNNNFALELYNPFDTDIPLSNFRLELRRQTGEVAATVSLAGYAIARQSRFVITNGSTASSAFGVSSLMSMGLGKEDPALVLALYDPVPDSDPPAYVLKEQYDLWLLRQTTASELSLDRQQTQDSWFTWDTVKNLSQSYARADDNWNVVYQDLTAASNTLGNPNGLDSSRKNYNFYESSNATGAFASVGEITRALTVGPSADPCDMIGIRLASEPPEELVRLDLRNPTFAKIFQYLTVIDPVNHGHSEYETRIKGRINVNTAPSFVIAQLPWMELDIARAIVAHRDTLAGAFQSTGALMQVPEMGYYAYDPAYASVDLDRLPDLTPSDGAVSDLEERDMIFSRISDITTVRSDVFSAYILVRTGTDGPQKRVLAILDRSQVTSPADTVRIVALHA
ncbi:MAG: type II secretion system protein GspK, partial [Planctomycetota bacterium]